MDSGKPYLAVEGRQGGLSISHDGEYVVAMAMIPASTNTMQADMMGAVGATQDVVEPMAAAAVGGGMR